MLTQANTVESIKKSLVNQIEHLEDNIEDARERRTNITREIGEYKQEIDQIQMTLEKLEEVSSSE